MGGVYYDVPRNMNYDDPYQDLHIHQTKGYRLLSGSDVMQVLRYRHDTDYALRLRRTVTLAASRRSSRF